MPYIRFNHSGTGSANPFVRILGFIVGFVLFVSAVLLGGIVIAAIIGFMLIAAVVIYVRIWWLTRKAGSGRREESFVEAEYQVIEPSTPDDKRD